MIRTVGLHLFARAGARAAQVVVLALVLSIAGSAQAAGFGAYVGLDFTDGTGEEVDDEFEVDTTRTAADFGFTLDTNLARDRLFNYRLKLGLQAGEREFDSEFSSTTRKEDHVGFALNQTFGLGLFRSKPVRVYMGPQIRLGLEGCTSCEDSTLVIFTLGAGVELGVNVNLGERLTLSPTVGYTFNLGLAAEAPDDDSFADDQVFVGGTHQVGVLFHIYFRTGGDQY